MSKSRYSIHKDRAINLRRQGKTYGEIQKIVGEKIPKSTLSNWCERVSLDPQYRKILEDAVKKNGRKGHALALKALRIKRENYLKSICDRIRYLEEIFVNKDVAKISLAMLYLGEGSKVQRGSLMFGNSDPRIIALFLRLLRYCYSINESKFRCTLQCRADQNIPRLEKFWSDITKIPLTQFYDARIDRRTIGIKSKKPDYKGVCRIDYFSADLFLELIKISDLICSKGL